MSALLEIPQHFFAVPYNGARYPGAPGAVGLADGANCQRFAYALLRHFDREVPPLRSSDLWEDVVHTQRVTTLQPLDLLLWNRTPEPWGAHVGVYVGQQQAIHLCKAVGVPVVWSLTRFAGLARYRCLLGAKRVVSAV